MTDKRSSDARPTDMTSADTETPDTPADAPRAAATTRTGGAAAMDASRRQFFRQLAGEVIAGAGHVVGAVTELRDRSAAEASAMFGQPAGTPSTPTAPTNGSDRA